MTPLLPDDAEFARDVKAKDIRWLIEDRIPLGMATLVAGRPGQKKSLWTAWLAAQVSNAGHGVIFSNGEDLRAETSKPRLQVAGADLSKVLFWTPTLYTDEGLEQCAQMIALLNAKLLVIDPVKAHFPRGTMDNRVIIAKVARMLEATGCALVAVHHVKKSAGKGSNVDPLDAIGGDSLGFMAACRFVYVWGTSPRDEDESILAGVKSNVAEIGSTSYTFELVQMKIEGKMTERPRLFETDTECEISASAVIKHRGGQVEEQEGAGAVKKAIAAEWLTTFLMFGPRPANEIETECAANGLSWATIRRAAKALEIVKFKVDNDTGQVTTATRNTTSHWALPEGHPALQVGDQAKTALGLAAEDLDGADLTVEDVLRMIDAHGTVAGDGEEEDDDE